ncbi:hypothetical protein FSARC_4283 [Fusarium sarcochroum]|uniref:NmrA-like domain-containing protein n=1 Tax=Fusarium sarcochroum TaxID=1208366 RepID=A0A8H4U293_9HYPO|nr:hypothetical protein FSARC_4283 [Fusarium sarcochroum]
MAENTTAIPQGSWVLVTAANGYTGSHIVFALLKRGFKVRGTVRDLDSSQWILNDDFVAPFVKSGDFELVVADTSKPDDFDQAVKGVSAVIHVAIITNLVPDPTAAWALPPYEADRIMPVYFAAKVEAEKAVWKFVQDEKLPWVVNSVSPCVILGDLRDDKHLRSVPPQFIEQLYLGNTTNLQTPAMYYSHVTDVALIHVAAALDPAVKGQRIQVLAKSFTWNTCLDLLRKACPSRKFIDNFIAGDPKLTYKIENDIAPGLLQKWAGRDWISLETSVTEMVDYMVKTKKLDA